MDKLRPCPFCDGEAGLVLPRRRPQCGARMDGDPA